MFRPIIFLLFLLSLSANAQQKPQKRDTYEFASEIPVYVEQLKQELTYPLAWDHSGIRSFSKWKKRARAKVFECMLTPPKPAQAYDMEYFHSDSNETLEEELDRFLACGNAAIMVCDVDSANNTK